MHFQHTGLFTWQQSVYELACGLSSFGSILRRTAVPMSGAMRCYTELWPSMPRNVRRMHARTYTHGVQREMWEDTDLWTQVWVTGECFEISGHRQLTEFFDGICEGDPAACHCKKCIMLYSDTQGLGLEWCKVQEMDLRWGTCSTSSHLLQCELRVTAVSIITGPQAAQIGVQFPLGWVIFLLQNVQMGSGVYPSSHELDTVGSFLRR